MKEFIVIRKLIPLLKIYRWAIPAVVVLGILSSIAEGIGISLFIPFLQSLEQTQHLPDAGNWLIDSFGQLLENVGPDQRLLIISGAILGSVLLRNVLSYSNSVLSNWLNVHIGHRLRCGIFEQLLTVSFRFLERSASGKLLNALTNETWRTSDALWILVDSIILICTLVVYATLLLLISWKLTALVAVAMVIISVLVRLLTRGINNLGNQITKTNTKLADRMVEGIDGMKVIRAFNREAYEQERFVQTSTNLSNALIKLGIISGAVGPIYELLAATLLIFILYSTLTNPGNLPSILVFIFILYRLQPKLTELDGARVGLLSLASAVEEVTSLLDPSDKHYLVTGSRLFQGLKKGIYFDQATFRYDPADKPALQDISVLIPAGKTTALVGPSGAGKSTIVKLILRLYEITDGEIYVDNYPLRELDLSAWRGRIAVVSQDVYIFNTTVRENIAYGRLDATKDEIIAAAKLADAHEFISALPQGYETMVGDRGVRLSGGQQQRITLARAIVRNPEILILDEATNALDSISEHLIHQALNAMRRDRTIIIIAHRPSTIEQADHIIVLDSGRVREQGTLQDLLQLDGLFARLYRPQHGKVRTRKNG